MNKEELIEQYKKTKKADTLLQIQTLNLTRGVSLDDISYLNRYVSICEDVISGAISNSEATKQLRELNKECQFSICPNTYKSTIQERSESSPDWYNSNC